MVEEYIAHISSSLSSGIAREHAYRSALERLMESFDNVKAINDPSRSSHGNPDFAFLKRDNQHIILGYAETKDIPIDLDKVETGEQLKRYLGYSNLLLTNYVDFRFFRNGEKYQSISIASLISNSLLIKKENFSLLENELTAFLTSKPERITNGKRLAEIMGGKAVRIRENVKQYFIRDKDKNEELQRIFNIIQKLLVHDLNPVSFADMYAQTLVYGLFVARYHDNSQDSFTRQEARELVPTSNPFLRHFFDHIVGPDFDKRLSYIVDELCEVFSVSNIRDIITQHFNLFGEATSKDPIIHFYENFLEEYDPIQRKKNGAYYTPLPVVNFIIRSVDTALVDYFDLPKGVSDISKVKHKVMLQGKSVTEQLHKVQILDPAVGTATFLNETVKFIKEKYFKNQEGQWPNYVNDDLLPRLYGFELMMVPYTIAHLKLAMTLRESGYTDFNRRIGVYLTNTLEPSDEEQYDLWSHIGLVKSISEEAHSANKIKNERPIMVVMGNPPYNVSSNNKNEFIEQLISIYKKDLNERKINLGDDYIKFIRFAEHLIEKNGSGIVAMITNNSFIDGITHRHMRKHLLKTFDLIYIVNLHGDTNKGEKHPDGTVDQNIFNIKQGVSINLFIKKQKTEKVTKVFYKDLYGRHKEKLNSLDKASLRTMDWRQLPVVKPYYFFVPKDFSNQTEYEKGFRIDELFPKYSSGIETAKDELIVRFDKEDIISVKEDFKSQTIADLVLNYPKVNEEKIKQVKRDINNIVQEYSVLEYRPFDFRYTLYTPNSQGVLWRPRSEIMNNLLGMNNIALQITKKNRQMSLGYAFVSNYITDRHLLDTAGDTMCVFPLYLDELKAVNFNSSIYDKLKNKVSKNITPEEVFDYIYGVLYSVSYREKYKHFIKINFPRIPYPKNSANFFSLSKKGKELRELHLMNFKRRQGSVTFPVIGTNVIEKVTYDDGKVFINNQQYFGNVSLPAWKFFIGGYQPAQKWLKSRKGLKIQNSDIEHYQNIIYVLDRTHGIMNEALSI